MTPFRRSSPARCICANASKRAARFPRLDRRRGDGRRDQDAGYDVIIGSAACDTPEWVTSCQDVGPAGENGNGATGPQAGGAAGDAGAIEAGPPAIDGGAALDAGAEADALVPACVLTPEQTTGPYYVSLLDIRSDITGGTADSG